MKAIVAACLGLTFVLPGCANLINNSIFGPPIEVQVERERERLHEARQARDDAKCRELGFKPGTEAYGNCRLQLEQIRATSSAAASAKTRKATHQSPAVEQDKKVYDVSECVGPVIMGRCKGSIIPNKAYHPTCHGEWLNGQCTGPMF